MRRLALATVATALALVATSGVAGASDNPRGQGPPNQSCQSVEAAGRTTPGHSASSPGSPFHKPGINSVNGGTGGQHYSATSQYDVACFQVSHR